MALKAADGLPEAVPPAMPGDTDGRICACRRSRRNFPLDSRCGTDTSNDRYFVPTVSGTISSI